MVPFMVNSLTPYPSSVAHVIFRCMGYHSAEDNRVPDKFICFDCRVRADRNWDLIVVHDLYPRMIARFKDLAIQRRASIIHEKPRVLMPTFLGVESNSSRLTHRMDCRHSRS